jgi:mono/diheme cytochrome c family protein
MPRLGLSWPATLIFFGSLSLLAPKTIIAGGNPAGPASLAAKLHVKRTSPGDIEIAGEIAGVPSGATRYLTRDDLLSVRQVTYTVSDDSNFARPTQVGGVPLEELARDLGAKPSSDLVVAICDDKYRANYSLAYLAEHNPVLVLTIEGKQPSGWPKSSDGTGMGQYMISHAKFTPAFKILSHSDEPQIPWGVVRLEFRNEATVFGAIAPHGPTANDVAVQSGFRIAQQNCFRCHNLGDQGGQKSGIPWTMLAAVAANSPDFFAQYVRNPTAMNPKSQMAANPGYDDATMLALMAYFRTFVPTEKP